MAKAPTERQRQLLQLIVDFIEDHGYPPTIREMMEGLGLSSLRGVTIHLDALERAGLIERLTVTGGSSHRARGLRVLAPAQTKSEARGDFLRLPLVGSIAAGTPILASQNVEDVIAVPSHLAKGAIGAFLLRVQGESMTGAHILPGDLVVIQPQKDAENGEIVAARIGDEATIKRFYRESGKIELQPQNPNYAPIALRKSDNVALIGKVIGLLRNM